MPDESRYAGFIRRLIAFVFDTIILFVTGMSLLFIQMILFPFTITSESLGLDFGINSNTMGALLISQVIVWGLYMILILWLYSAMLESSSRRGTIGKQALNLTVCDVNGGRLSFLRASLRFIGKILSAVPLFLGFFLVAFTERKQGLDDFIAGTLVFYADTEVVTVQTSPVQVAEPAPQETVRKSNLALYLIIGCILVIILGPLILSGIMLFSYGQSDHSSSAAVPAGSYPSAIMTIPTPRQHWDPVEGSGASLLPQGVWHRVVNQTPFQDRILYTVTVFNNRFWVIGGVGKNGPTNDIWCSEDGITWTLVNPAAPFMPRSSHTAVAFDNRLWVIGGYRESKDHSFRGRLNDVWSSPDGVTWTEPTSSAAFTPRHGLSSGTYDGRMWVIGGYTNEDTNTNDVWSSVDGITWTAETPAAPFLERSNANVVDDGKRLFVIGGENVYGKVSDSWHSTDGSSWYGKVALPFATPNSQTVVPVNGTLFALQDELQTNGIQLRGFWYSADGEHWDELTPPPGYSGPFSYNGSIGRDEYRMAYKDDRIWIFRKYVDTDTTVRNDVWSAPVASLLRQPPQARFMASTTYGPAPLSVGFTDFSVNRPDRLTWDFGDRTTSSEKNPVHTFTAAGNYTVSLTAVNSFGSHAASRTIIVDAPVADAERWTLAVPDLPFKERFGFGLAEHNGKIWMAGGSNYADDFNDVWSSSDGITWTRVTGSASFPPRSAFTFLSYNGRLWVIGGLTHKVSDFYKKEEICTSDVWSSVDGITWTEVTSHTGFTPRCEQASAVYADRMWIIAGRGIRDGKNPAVKYNDVWSSSDGVIWTQATASAAFSPRDETTAFVYDNFLWILGSYNDEELWKTSDGKKWTLVTHNRWLKSFGGRSPVVLNHNDRLWLIQDYSWGSLSSAPILYSYDGSTWTSFSPDFSPTNKKGSYVSNGVVFNNRMWIIGDNELWYSGS